LIPSHRQWFNRNYSDAEYARFLQLLDRRCGSPPRFRHSETPVFLPAALVDKMARYGREMVDALLADPQYRHDSAEAVPAAWRTRANEAERRVMIERHRAVAQAIAQGDEAAAVAAMEAHFDDAVGDMLRTAANRANARPIVHSDH